MVKMEKVIASGNKLYKEEILKIIKNYNIKCKWYVISFYEEYDGNFYELEEALNNVLSLGMASIIISDEIAIIETEQCFGTPERYILHI